VRPYREGVDPRAKAMVDLLVEMAIRRLLRPADAGDADGRRLERDGDGR